MRNLLGHVLRDRATAKFVEVCEVGFNAGHSTLNWLAADPRTAVDAFDLGAHPSAAAAFAYLSKKYPGRLRLTLGDSRATLPLVDHKKACDVVFIDGGHDSDVPAADLGNLAPLAARGAPLLVDNANMAPVHAAIANATARGLLPDGQPIFADNGQVSNRYTHTGELLSPPYQAVFQTNSWGSGLTTQYNSASMQMDDILFDFDIVICQSQSNNGDKNSRPQAWALPAAEAAAARDGRHFPQGGPRITPS